MANRPEHTLYWGTASGSRHVARPAPSARLAALDEALHTVTSLAGKPRFHTLALEALGLPRAVLPGHPAHALDPSLYGVLLSMRGYNSASPSQIGGRLGLDPSTVSHHLKRLELLGLITRHGRLPYRGRLTFLTEPGILAFETVREARHALLGRVLAGCDDDEQELLVSALERFAKKALALDRGS